MELGSLFSVTGIGFLMICVFIIAAVGYALGRITIKGVNLGTAGVFIVALIFGVFFYGPMEEELMISGKVEFTAEDAVVFMAEETEEVAETEEATETEEVAETEEATETEAVAVTKSYSKTYTDKALKVLENLGLMLFVTAVGFIAGPNFFAGLKKNFKSYILLGAVIIIAGAAACILCVVAFDCNASMAVGILSGALTSTPAFSAAKETVQVIAENPEMAANLENMVTVGHGIAYLFGVVGVVLFVQLVPKFRKANMAEERAKLVVASDGNRKAIDESKLIAIDGFGFAPFAFAVVCGILLGGIKIPMGNSAFSLGTTGGTLLASLIIAHFGRIGKISMKVNENVLKCLRELGLMMFLIGAGIPGGAHFVEYFEIEYFFYGVLMTIVPMIVGYIVAAKVLKLPMLNNLGSITGGMTSTPALGTLINVSGTDDVASAYAATYPVALVLVVLVSQFVILLF